MQSKEADKVSRDFSFRAQNEFPQKKGKSPIQRSQENASRQHKAKHHQRVVDQLWTRKPIDLFYLRAGFFQKLGNALNNIHWIYIERSVAPKKAPRASWFSYTKNPKKCQNIRR